MALRGWSTMAENRATARRLEMVSKCTLAVQFRFASAVMNVWRESITTKIAVKTMIVGRWSAWLSVWFRLVEVGNVWRNAKLRALELGQVNGVRRCFQTFARGIQLQRTHDRYASRARVMVDQVQNAAQNEIAAIQQDHAMSVLEIEGEFRRKVLQVRTARVLLSRTVINRMLKIRKAILFDNFSLSTALLKSQLVEANLDVDRICKRKATALCLRHLQWWVTEVQACRIDALEVANQANTNRINELEQDKLILQNLVEEALLEQEQLAVDYHSIAATKPKGKIKGKAQSSRSRSPLRQKSRNPGHY